MPNVAKVLKEEIARIGRKESRAAVTPVHRRTIQLERSSADLKRRVAALERLNKDLHKRLAQLAPVATAAPAPASRNWISGKGVKSLRKQLGVSQADLARLVGVSDQSVYNWESAPGKLNLRDVTRANLLAMRSLGAREAKRRLAEMSAKKPAPGRKAKSGK